MLIQNHSESARLLSALHVCKMHVFSQSLTLRLSANRPRTRLWHLMKALMKPSAGLVSLKQTRSEVYERGSFNSDTIRKSRVGVSCGSTAVWRRRPAVPDGAR